MNISIAIVEDNHDIRLALEQIIEMADNYSVAGSYVSGEDALLKIPVIKPEIVLIDINLGGINGIEVVKILKKTMTDVLFMMCTIYEEDEKIFEALSAGASGYILKKTAPDKLLTAIKELQDGGSPMSSQIARKVVSHFQNTSNKTTVNDSLNLLSSREKEILEMLSRGLTYKEIADTQGHSRQSITRKMNKIPKKHKEMMKVKRLKKIREIMKD
jgi:DNA-binding NarL/FixJ family response regulator